ncbi:Bro-N domain-containing protein [Caballeronia sp. LZ025]|uniref:BRO-N domain-containing protein n=1 Tax=Caballeronia TaxID=1827195 RepID=UPI001FD42CE6|nr:MULTISPECIES: Bro-N domain-containing protein [Caballeronia]MDR5731264.1 Bro-N domain-containing protein [Caballeronia sp. LZ025]
MTSLTVFNFRSNEVRTVTDENGEPWFVAADIARLLGYSNPRDAVGKHCKGVAKRDILTSGGVQELTVIPERDIYRLVMRSKLPAAEAFEEWVVGEVLPSIRKHGGYVAPTAGSADAFVAHYLPNLSEAAKAEIVLGLFKRVDELEAEKVRIFKQQDFRGLRRGGDVAHPMAG